MTEASAPAPYGATIAEGEKPAIPLVSDAYRRYALLLLMLVYTVRDAQQSGNFAQYGAALQRLDEAMTRFDSAK